jgi:hypothetical protein
LLQLAISLVIACILIPVGIGLLRSLIPVLSAIAVLADAAKAEVGLWGKIVGGAMVTALMLFTSGLVGLGVGLPVVAVAGVIEELVKLGLAPSSVICLGVSILLSTAVATSLVFARNRPTVEASHEEETPAPKTALRTKMMVTIAFSMPTSVSSAEFEKSLRGISVPHYGFRFSRERLKDKVTGEVSYTILDVNDFVTLLEQIRGKIERRGGRATNITHS